MSELTPVERLVLAGYRQNRSTFRVTFSDDVEDSELVFWTTPTGDTITEKKALEQLAEREGKD